MHEPPSDETPLQRHHRAIRDRVRAALAAEGERPLDRAAAERVLGAVWSPTAGQVG